MKIFLKVMEFSQGQEMLHPNLLPLTPVGQQTLLSMRVLLPDLCCPPQGGPKEREVSWPGCLSLLYVALWGHLLGFKGCGYVLTECRVGTDQVSLWIN